MFSDETIKEDTKLVNDMAFGVCKATEHIINEIVNDELAGKTDRERYALKAMVTCSVAINSINALISGGGSPRTSY